jgi:Na+/proline symporter
MSALDWTVLVGWLTFIVCYGVWRGRGSRDLKGYLLADRRMSWHTMALAVMATQASAITFLSTPGQGYADGMRFVQFYFGLPIAMVVLSATAVPVFHRLKVFTAYEYLESRFDLKTRSLAALLFLVQRGLAAGLTIYAPSLILSVLLGWDLAWTNFFLGALVVIYTASGGVRSVNHTQFLQFILLLTGLAVAFTVVVTRLPEGMSLFDATWLAGKLGKLNAVDYSFDPQNRYNLWSGLIGGCFLALSYFGTDQSQVGRYLTGRSVAQSRLSLLFNGMVKVPMQFGILFLGAMVFVFYQFAPAPVFFNPHQVRKLEAGSHASEFRALEQRHEQACESRTERARELLSARRARDAAELERAEAAMSAARGEVQAVRGDLVKLIERADPGGPTSDTNYVFLSFVLRYFPAGVIGLVLAATFAASMSSTSAELNALASTTVVDVYRRFRRGPAEPRREVQVSQLATVLWGAFAIGFAESASRLGSLIEAVNILGSLFYGTILGIFLAAFYLKRVGGHAVFLAALLAEAAVVCCFLFTKLSFLWYNVVGCLLVMMLAVLFQSWPRRSPARAQA